MAKKHPITPFPADIDRYAFGHYLSGLTDGEGCFMLKTYTEQRSYGEAVFHRVMFAINLRDDDTPILRLIQSYFDCGRLTSHKRPIGEVGKRQAQTRLEITRPQELACTVVPHFEKYPLRAKKSRDFAIWKEGVALAYEVFQRRVIKSPLRHGALPRWSPEDHAHFDSLVAAITVQREYKAPQYPVPVRRRVSPPSLFGD